MIQTTISQDASAKNTHCHPCAAVDPGDRSLLHSPVLMKAGAMLPQAPDTPVELQLSPYTAAVCVYLVFTCANCSTSIPFWGSRPPPAPATPGS